MPPYSLLSTTDSDLRLLRWENAKELTNRFIRYCEKNQYKFKLIDYPDIIYPSDIHITEDQILIILNNYPKITTFIVYDNTDSFHSDFKNSTHNWHVENLLFNAQIIQIHHDKTYLHVDTVIKDTIM